MLTTEEVSQELGLKQASIRQYIKRGLIAAIKRGPMNFITRSELDRFKEERERSGKSKDE